MASYVLTYSVYHKTAFDQINALQCNKILNKKKINNISRKKNGDLNSSLFSIPAAKQTLQQQQYCGKSETVRAKADTTKRALMVYKHLL